MDKAEYQSRLEELNSLVKKEDYEGALAVVEAVDWRRVKSLRTLGMVADVYEANKRYPEAKKILLMAYDRSSIGKGILYRLVEVSVKMKDFDEAIDFYNEFEAVARHDNSRYLLKYKILRAAVSGKTRKQFCRYRLALVRRKTDERDNQSIIKRRRSRQTN